MNTKIKKISRSMLSVFKGIGSIIGMYAVALGMSADRQEGPKIWIEYIAPALFYNIAYNFLVWHLLFLTMIIIAIVVAIRKILISDFTQTVCKDEKYYAWAIKVLEKVYGSEYLMENTEDENGMIQYYPCTMIKTKECIVDDFKLEEINFDRFRVSNMHDEEININLNSTCKCN
ncbi:MAG: hypothetical protein SNJ29_10655 [Rikenellaceae bacterium]